MACPDHRPTTSQVRAGVPLRPALVWTSTAEEQTLSSNGIPAWFDEDGHEHPAAAWTWRHPATGRSGNQIPPGNRVPPGVDRGYRR